MGDPIVAMNMLDSSTFYTSGEAGYTDYPILVAQFNKQKVQLPVDIDPY